VRQSTAKLSPRRTLSERQKWAKTFKLPTRNQGVPTGFKIIYNNLHKSFEFGRAGPNNLPLMYIRLNNYVFGLIYWFWSNAQSNINERRHFFVVSSTSHLRGKESRTTLTGYGISDCVILRIGSNRQVGSDQCSPLSHHETMVSERTRTGSATVAHLPDGNK
jgi:hypothetical protein